MYDLVYNRQLYIPNGCLQSVQPALKVNSSQGNTCELIRWDVGTVYVLPLRSRSSDQKDLVAT